MLTKLLRVTLIVMVVASMAALSPATLSAQTSPGGTGPDDAMAPTGAWTELKEGEVHWYVFRFEQDPNKVMQPVEIRLYSEPLEGSVLTVHNQEQAELWRQTGEREHFGCCSLVDVDRDGNGVPDYAVWSGSLRATDNYYIVVAHAKGVSGVVHYRFTVSGDGLSFPTAPAKPAAAAVQPAAQAKPVALADLVGTAPDFAMRPTGEWTKIDTGQYQWYLFRFEYDPGVTGPVEIKLYSEPWNGAVLTIRNEEQADQWRAEGEHKHFGCCTGVNVDKDNDGTPDYMLWAGSLRSTGTYYAVVEHARDVTGPVYYRFTMSGKGLSFPSAPYVPQPEPKAAAPAPAAKPMPKAVTGLEGSGPDNTMKPSGAWLELQEGQYHWYSFKFKFESGVMMKPVEIRLYAEPLEGAVLTVRNEEQADLWRTQGKEAHVGCCTTVDVDKNNDGKPDYALWAGNLGATDTYYIVVEHAKDVKGPVYYSFTIGGDGVTTQ